MIGFMEKSVRGTAGFPFQVYRDTGRDRGRTIAAAHYHDDIEIMKPQAGVTDLIIDGTLIKAVPDCLYFINPSEIHSMHTNDDSYYHCFVFSKELLSFSKDSVISKRLIDPLFSGELRFCAMIDDPYCLQLFDEIDEMSKSGEKYAAAIVAKLLMMLAHIEERGLLTKFTAHTHFQEPIHRAIQYMETNFTESITLTQIASQVGMSSKYFCSYFKKYTRMTVVTYLNNLRIHKAKEYLRNGVSVLESGLSCGFENNSFFIKKFKECVGMTPGKYKKEQELLKQSFG